VLVGGFVAALLGRYWAGPGPAAGRDDELQFTDNRVIEHLPLYLGADDLEFVRRLQEANLFPADGPAGPPAEPPPADKEKLTALFKSYPPARQQQLRRLDQDFHELPDADRLAVGRVLERYAVWLDRLPDPSRKAVLYAPTREDRVEVVAGLLAMGRREALPLAVRKKMENATIDERLKLQNDWQAAEQLSRDEWQLARRQWAAVTDKDRKPWPFDDDKLAKQVDDFVRTALRVDFSYRPAAGKKDDLPAGLRLTPAEWADLRAKRFAAEQFGNWFVYGLQVYRLAEKYPYLPPPVGKPPVTEPEQVGSKRARPILAAARYRGKWPEYALAVNDSFRRSGFEPPSGLGPAKREEFPKALQEFVNQTLIPGLTGEESARLNGLEGKWPDYPQEIVKLARKYDHPVPGVTLPGSPHQWGKFYALKP
jgi:hypothetical protein